MRLEISCQDRLGIAQDVLDILVNHEIDLRGIEIDIAGKIFLNFPNIEFADFQHLMPKIRLIDGIDDVKTTPFMPIERERNQLRALLQTIPDPVFSIDTKGHVFLVNDAVLSSLETSKESVLGTDISEWIKGFNIHRWLEGKQVLAQARKVKFIEQDYLADFLPVTIPDAEGEPILGGAVLLLKSEFRLGQQLTVFHQTNVDSFSAIQANSSVMKKVIREAKRMAELDGALIIFGETGTGKEMIAKACHESSRRHNGAFLALNCTSIPDNEAESELFGGCTGASDPKIKRTGLLELANTGTLFLNEVGDMSAQLQGKLLRVLQDGSFRQLNGEECKVDVRIICTTQKDLGQMVEEGKFREDLYYRLNVLSLVVPPLRERKSDIVPLAEVFIKQHAMKLGIRPPKLNKSCVDYLMSYPWPGNARQLENALYRALSLLEGNELSKEHIQLPSCASSVTYMVEEFDGTLDEEVRRFEKDLLKRLYPSYPSTRQLARKLGLSHTAIANKLREYGINKKSIKI